MDNQQLALREKYNHHSIRLIGCMALLNSTDLEQRSAAKLELVNTVSGLMEKGQPKFVEIPRYPSVVQLVQKEGIKNVTKALYLLVKDFCMSIKVKENLSDDEMIEVAGWLIDEADTFRLEDYAIMFTLAKRGELVQIYNRVDFQFIKECLDAYYQKRAEAGRKIQEQQFQEFENKVIDKRNEGGEEFADLTGKLTGALKQVEKEIAEERAKEEEQATEKRKESFKSIQWLLGQPAVDKLQSDKKDRA